MSIGVALATMAIGAILTFATRGSPSGLNLRVVGIILMLTAGVGLYFRMIGFGPERRIVVLPSRRRARNASERRPSDSAPFIQPKAHQQPPDSSPQRSPLALPAQADEPTVYVERRMPTEDAPGLYEEQS